MTDDLVARDAIGPFALDPEPDRPASPSMQRVQEVITTMRYRSASERGIQVALRLTEGQAGEYGLQVRRIDLTPGWRR